MVVAKICYQMWPSNYVNQFWHMKNYPESKFHGANKGPIWGRQDPDGPRVDPINLAFWVSSVYSFTWLWLYANNKQMGCLDKYYSIHVPGWLQKWLNLITAPGSVSNEPGSVTWLATKYLKTVSWRNHTEKLTTWWTQNISFWPKINIPSSYFTILMLNCLENTLKLQFDSYVTAVRFLT